MMPIPPVSSPTGQRTNTAERTRGIAGGRRATAMATDNGVNNGTSAQNSPLQGGLMGATASLTGAGDQQQHSATGSGSGADSQPCAGSSRENWPTRPGLNGLPSLSNATPSAVGQALFERLEGCSLIHCTDDFVLASELQPHRNDNLASHLPPRHSVVDIAINGTSHPVHANWVAPNIIAAQSPSSHIIQPGSIGAFYATVLDNRFDTIVSLADNSERQNRLCVFKFWPFVGTTAQFVVGDRAFNVTTRSDSQQNGYQTVLLNVQEQNSTQVRTVNLHRFIGWPDGGVPDRAAQGQFQTFVDATISAAGTGNMLVHSSEGVGRTGTFIVLQQLQYGIDSGVINQDNLLEHLADLVWTGRIARGADYVQTPEQMVMIIEHAKAAIDGKNAASAGSKKWPLAPKEDDHSLPLPPPPPALSPLLMDDDRPFPPPPPSAGVWDALPIPTPAWQQPAPFADRPRFALGSAHTNSADLTQPTPLAAAIQQSATNANVAVNTHAGAATGVTLPLPLLVDSASDVNTAAVVHQSADLDLPTPDDVPADQDSADSDPVSSQADDSAAAPRHSGIKSWLHGSGRSVSGGAAAEKRSRPSTAADVDWSQDSQNQRSSSPSAQPAIVSPQPSGRASDPHVARPRSWLHRNTPLQTLPAAVTPAGAAVAAAQQIINQGVASDLDGHDDSAVRHVELVSGDDLALPSVSTAGAGAPPPPGGDGNRPPQSATGDGLARSPQQSVRPGTRSDGLPWPAPDVTDLTSLSALSVAQIPVTARELFGRLSDARGQTHHANDFVPASLLRGQTRDHNILPPSHSVLSVHVNGAAEFVHANRIAGGIIAGQGPVSGSAYPVEMATFFATLMDNNVDRAVDLADGNDLPTPAIAREYWPAPGITEYHVLGNRTIEVSYVGESLHSGYRIITLELYDQNRGQTQTVELYQFFGWPAGGAPMASAGELAAFNQAIGAGNNILVHSDLGVGRTGTFIVLRQLLEGINAGSINQGNLIEQVSDLITQGRIDRGSEFVQTCEQVQMLIEHGLAAIATREVATGFDDDWLPPPPPEAFVDQTVLRGEARSLQRADGSPWPPAPTVSDIMLAGRPISHVASELFNRLDNFSAGLHLADDFVPAADVRAGVRYNHILPPVGTVVGVDVDGENLSVHANWVAPDIISAQGPMSTTGNPEGVAAFFATILDNQVDRVVNLTSPREVTTTTLEMQYWPAVGETRALSLGGRTINVTTHNVRHSNSAQIVSLMVVEPYSGLSQRVELCHFTGWPDGGVPTRAMNGLVDIMQDIISGTQHGNLLVHSDAGMGRTGTFIVLRQLIEGVTQGTVNRNNLLQRISDLVSEGRISRGPEFVGNPRQMAMIIELGLAAVNGKAGESSGENLAPASPGVGPQGAAAPVDSVARGAVGRQSSSGARSPVRQILHMMAYNQLATPDGRQALIDEAQWRRLLQPLTSEQLHMLVAHEDGPFHENSGLYPQMFTRVALEVFAEATVPRVIQTKRSAQLAAEELARQFRPGSAPQLEDALARVLDRYVYAERVLQSKMQQHYRRQQQ